MTRSRVLLAVHAMASALVATSACGGLVAIDASSMPEGGSGGVEDSGSSPITPPSGDASSPIDAAVAPAPVIAADGVCVDANVSTGIVDPDCVYLLGTLQEGDAWRNVLIDPRDPKDRAFGFGYTFRAPIIHPKTGKLTFIASGDTSGSRHLYEFGTSTAPTASPNAQIAAHTMIPTTRCSASSLLEHYIFPDDGVVAYDCNGNPGATWVYGATMPVARQGYLPVAVGNDRVILAAKTAPDYAVLIDGAVVPVQGLDTNTFLGAVRSRPTGGFLAVGNATGIRGQLLEIATDGTTTPKGSYDFGTPPVGPSGSCVLEPAGSLVCIGKMKAAPYDVDAIYRFRVGGAAPELLYEERMSDVKIHISHLVTGP